MIWLCLIVQTVGLGVIALCFKAEDKDGYAATFGMGGLLSLVLVVAASPFPVKLLIGFLIVLFCSRMNLAFANGQVAILSCVRMSLQALTKLSFTWFDPVSRRMPKFLFQFVTHSTDYWRQEQRTENIQYPNMTIIDVEAIEVTHQF